MGCIYKITNKINGKIYIGQTKYSVEKRWKGHVSKTFNNNKDNCKFHNAIRKYGPSNFKLETLENVDDSLLNEREIFWISFFNSEKDGYNSTSGGEFETGNPVYNEEVKEKIRKKATGRILSEETKKKMSINNGRYWKTHKVSDSTIKAAAIGRSKKLKGSNNPMAVKVAMIDPKTNVIIKNFDCVKDANDWIKQNVKKNHSQTGISKVINGKQKTSAGYKWKKV